MKNPKDLYYTENHEWVRVDENHAYIGITAHAQTELGEIVYVEMPEPDKEIESGEEVLTIESLKAASPVYAPVSGSIVEINEELEDAPDLLNEDPYENHIFVVEMNNPEEVEHLLSVGEYEDFLKEA
ncbi:MAG: glycine cleavage system protein GcvH [Sediminispirochaetaceae bacterium]